jgi:hypothetical protein
MPEDRTNCQSCHEERGSKMEIRMRFPKAQLREQEVAPFAHLIIVLM